MKNRDRPVRRRAALSGPARAVSPRACIDRGPGISSSGCAATDRRSVCSAAPLWLAGLADSIGEHRGRAPAVGRGPRSREHRQRSRQPAAGPPACVLTARPPMTAVVTAAQQNARTRSAVAARAQALALVAVGWGALAFGGAYPWAYWPLAMMMFVAGAARHRDPGRGRSHQRETRGGLRVAGCGHRDSADTAAARVAPGRQPERAGRSRENRFRLRRRADALSLLVDRRVGNPRITRPVRSPHRPDDWSRTDDGVSPPPDAGRGAHSCRRHPRTDRHRAAAAVRRPVAGFLDAGGRPAVPSAHSSTRTISPDGC